MTNTIYNEKRHMGGLYIFVCRCIYLGLCTECYNNIAHNAQGVHKKGTCERHALEWSECLETPETMETVITEVGSKPVMYNKTLLPKIPYTFKMEHMKLSSY